MSALVQVQPMRNLSQENMAERDNSHCPLSFTFAFEYINTGPHVHTCEYTHFHKPHIAISHTCMSRTHTSHKCAYTIHKCIYYITHKTNKQKRSSVAGPSRHTTSFMPSLFSRHSEAINLS